MKNKKNQQSFKWMIPATIILIGSLFVPFSVFGRSSTDQSLFDMAVNSSLFLRVDQAQLELEALAAADIAYPLTDLTMIMSDSGYGALKINTNNDGDPIEIRGQTFSSGIGVFATSVISYDLQGKCSTFSSYIGVDDSVALGAGSVRFQIFTDGTRVYDHGTMVSDNYPDNTFAPHPTGLIDVVNVDELILVVTTDGDHHYQDKANWAEPVITCSSLPNGDGTSFTHKRGSWEPVMDWPVKAIHASLLPSGHILSHASEDETSIANDDWDGPNPPTYDLTKVDLSDINTWSHEWVNHPSEEMYCSAHTLLSDGSLFEFGGHDGVNGDVYGKDQASIFDFQTKTWQPQQKMNQARWYPSALTLGNGDVLAIGGTHGTDAENIFKPEIFNGTDWRVLNNVDYSTRLLSDDNLFDHTYPYVHLVSDGRVFWSGWDKNMSYIDVTGNGAWGQTYPREDIFRNWAAPIMYRQDKIMLIGGVVTPVEGDEDRFHAYGYATDKVQLIDLTDDAPTTTPTSNMTYARADADGTLLANGEVFINGGSAYHFLGDNPTKIFVPEIWNPDSGEWRFGAQADKPRGYHSSSLLLPDGRVWAAGGECGDDCTDGMTAQIYNPPYLFKQDGSGEFAPRPTINSIDQQITYARPFEAEVSSTDGVSKVSFIRLGSSTHHINFEQRYAELSFRQNGSTLSIDPPEHGNLAPPGFYMVFVFDNNGVPSVAEIVQILPKEEAEWKTVSSTDGSTPTERHESAYVEVNDKFYLMGGRVDQGVRPVEMFDPVTGKWTSIGNPPVDFHHIQPVVVDGLIYVVGGLLGGYPNETAVENVYIFDPSDNSWTTGPTIPEARRRGSAGTAVYNGKIYLLGGNNLGHNAGYQAWFDMFDPTTNIWTILTDAPRARDHFTAVVIGTKLFAAGGRQTDQPVPFDNTVPEVDVYDFSTGSWSVLVNDLPTERAGTISLAHGKDLIVLGGESNNQGSAYSQTEVLDVNTGEWANLPEMITGRHSGGAVIWDDHIYAVAGSGNQGGWPELNSQESLALDPAEPLDSNETGKILRESWIDIEGITVSDLTGSAKFANSPDSTEMLSSFESPQDWADNYGQQVRGYIHPPVSGLYRFWIASDDASVLYLSADTSSANKTEIASVPGFAGFREYTKYTEQQSVEIMLEAGQKYYIEALHKEGTGGDHLTVAWQIPGASQAIVAGQYLSPFVVVPVTGEMTPTPIPNATVNPTAIPSTTPMPMTPVPSQTPTPSGTPNPPSTSIPIYLPIIVR